MNQGLYEELVTKLINYKINELDKDTFHVKTTPIDKAEAAQLLSQHIGKTIRQAFNLIKGEDVLETQIEIANKIILFLNEELKKEEFEDDLIETEGKILKAVFTKVDAHFTDLNLHLKEITPYTRLIHSELFTGGNSGTTLESELRKEILSSNKIDLLVSFIKWKGIRILERELREFTERGGKLRVITTTYIGATDAKAVEFLASLENTEVKVSYNTGNERLHAKAYLFQRNTGFHTGYIGSSNFSRSALTDGLEWNLKITTKEVSHIIDKFKKTFEAYWQNSEFELYDRNIHSVKLVEALKQGKLSKEYTFTTSFFDIKPFHYQNEILEKLEVERAVHNRYKNLLVAATGTGKTVISAFDYKNFRSNKKSSRLLFVAHRKEILQQAKATFQGVLKDNNFGALWVDGLEPTSNEYVFASVQTLNNRLKEIKLSPEYYDFIIIDEVHHISAATYRPIINYFKPKVLLGLTATPERMDNENILEDFCNRIAAEIRLPEALNKKLLSPFQYFGITDSIDLRGVKWEKGKYVASELTNLYTKNDVRVGEIISNLNKYTNDINDVRAIGFCVTIEHASFMAEKFNLAGLKAEYLTAKNSSERDRIREQFRKKEFNYLFVVDIFNEGVDIPEIDTVLFLRPTESLTVFLQQLGRGLRLAEGKDCLTVLDFVGNSRPEYDFESKFRALIGKTTTSVQKEIEDDFPHLPLGCSIVLEKRTKETILENIKRATSLNVNQLINKIINFQHQTTLPLTLNNFIELNHITIETIYKKDSWSRLCQRAGVINDFENTNEKQIYSAIGKKWLSTNSTSYFNFILKIAKQGFNIKINDFNENEKTMLLMLHYDVWQSAGGFDSLEKSIIQIGKNRILVKEIIEVLEILIDKIGFKEIDIKLPYEQSLKLHARYTRDQILVAFGLSTFDKKSSNREGAAENKKLNTEILFINLIKSEENFSPTTMYDDYAISETLFHWQSHNAYGPETGKGLSYINHGELNKKMLLFVREKANDENGNTLGYVFIGEANFRETEGSKPMSIKWELNEPMPNYLWKESAKMSVG
ncbi:DEAD/DEAH box helicase [Flavobacterium aquatile]|uniref:Restriction endonuclease subunit R n=1 Tax=Flavobacterium aquatile LMG 4008 = ATCC 11947 TaxID=1453498 RepID=A0A095SX00_9FLAO|nr:DEAD/DEAH box helicase [Flavobacterium aquatile]KGD68904.1 restriction endonuclease subunit R [Flavobacterium aquatile LMG 4008 = ATCC 11947]OXA69422.1 restriction endonuclease subunit R [Flavobacterium aquatile LMG 4008 = ATCC 11947]GEC79395.1 type III restriction-modification system restriction subunit Res [Flavobacterium aquatile]